MLLKILKNKILSNIIKNNVLSHRYHNDSRSIIRLNHLQKEMVSQIRKKFQNGEYEFTALQPCKSCGSTDFVGIAEKDRYGLSHPVKMCMNCALIQQNPHYTQKTYNQFYDEEYRQLYIGKRESASNKFSQRYFKGLEIKNFLDRYNFKYKKVLEVGTGTGAILKPFKEKGFLVKGIDLGTEYITYGKQQGLDLETNTINDVVDFNPDIIIYCHVLEHILNPSRELNIIKNKFPNAAVYIELPGVRNLFNSYRGDFLRQLQNAHITYFTAKTLTNLLEKEGFIVEKINNRIQCVARYSGKNKNIHNEPPEELLLYLYGCEFKRYIITMLYHVKCLVITILTFLGLKDYVKLIYNKIFFKY